MAIAAEREQEGAFRRDAPMRLLIVDRGGPGNNLEEFFFETPYTVG